MMPHVSDSRRHVNDSRSRVDRMAGRVAAVTERYPYVFVGLFVVGYLWLTCARANRKLFWFDELFSVTLARLPDVRALWSALEQGVDFNPPLFYLLTRWSELALGESHIGARLPEILAVGILCVCVFAFVARRSSVLGGIVAMLFPLTTTAYWYASEARPHALVLGCCGVALVSWQRAAEQERRRAGWLIALALAL